jgi:8-oxo-dGTP diphosphatase
MGGTNMFDNPIDRGEIVFGEKLEGINYITRKGVYGVAFNENGQVAIIQNHYGYFLPGGGLEDNESIKECLLREFKEELGCGVYIDNYIGQASMYYFSDVFNHYRHPVGFFFTVDIIAQKNAKAIEEDLTLIWMNPHDCIRHMLKHQAWAVSEVLKYRE